MDVCDYDIQELLSIILCLFWKILHGVSIEIIGYTSNDWKIFTLRFGTRMLCQNYALKSPIKK